MIFLILYLILVNAIAFFRMGGDKRAAKSHARRVPERSLFLVAAIGGALGTWLGMRAFRHKTKHASFVYGVPALLALNAVCLWALLAYGPF